MYQSIWGILAAAYIFSTTKVWKRTYDIKISLLQCIWYRNKVCYGAIHIQGKKKRTTEKKVEKFREVYLGWEKYSYRIRTSAIEHKRKWVTSGHFTQQKNKTKQWYIPN